MHAILMTDLHLVDPARSPDAAAHAARIGARLDRAAEKAPGAEFCILAGDLADAGEVGAYDWLRKKLDTLPFPVVPMLGNHDDREAFRQVFADLKDTGGYIQSSRRLGGSRLVFLDTLDPGSAAGVLCPERLDWLDEHLRDKADVSLFMHHPPCDIGDPVLDPIKLSNAGDLASLIQKHGNVRNIFFGHVHRTLFLTWNGIPCVSLDKLGSPGPDAPAKCPPVCGLLRPSREGLALTVQALV